VILFVPQHIASLLPASYFVLAAGILSFGPGPPVEEVWNMKGKESVFLSRGRIYLTPVCNSFPFLWTFT
jgi:hypothetical protein